MASHKKFNRTGAIAQINHIERNIKNSSNPDIETARSPQNYSLLDDGRTAMERYKTRLQQVHVYGRKDTVTLVGICLTVPADITEPAQQERFFVAAATWMAEVYGHENICAATVHMDEAGRSIGGTKIKPHLHFAFLPVVPNRNHVNSEFAEKVCAHEIMGKQTGHLAHWHQNLQKYLDENLDFPARILTGAVKKGGGRNFSVREIKANTPEWQKAERKREQERTREADRARTPGNLEVYDGR